MTRGQTTMTVHSLDDIDAVEVAALFVLVVARMGEIGSPVIDELVSLLDGTPEDEDFDEGVGMLDRWLSSDPGRDDE